MQLKNEAYQVQISVDTTYTICSADNRPYDLVWNEEKIGRNDFYKALSISVADISRDENWNAVLVGDFFSYDADCAVLEGDVLTVLQNGTVTQISLKEKRILRQISFHCDGIGYGIHRCARGYLVFGELEATMLNANLEEVWSFSGADIFATQDGTEAFVLCADRVKLRDWEGNYYEVDLDGNEITQ